jgi:hypothetical protein
MNFNNAVKSAGLLPAVAAVFLMRNIPSEFKFITYEDGSKAPCLRFRLGNFKLYEFLDSSVYSKKTACILQEYGCNMETLYTSDSDFHRTATGTNKVFNLVCDAIELVEGTLLPINIKNYDADDFNGHLRPQDYLLPSQYP